MRWTSQKLAHIHILPIKWNNIKSTRMRPQFFLIKCSLKKTKPKLFGVRKNKVEEELNAQDSPTYGEDTPPSSFCF